MGFRDSENPLRVYNIFLGRHIFLGRVQTAVSRKVQTIPCDGTHAYHVIFFDKSLATNILFPRCPKNRVMMPNTPASNYLLPLGFPLNNDILKAGTVTSFSS